MCRVLFAFFFFAFFFFSPFSFFGLGLFLSPFVAFCFVAFFFRCFSLFLLFAFVFLFSFFFFFSFSFFFSFFFSFLFLFLFYFSFAVFLFFSFLFSFFLLFLFFSSFFFSFLLLLIFLFLFFLFFFFSCFFISFNVFLVFFYFLSQLTIYDNLLDEAIQHLQGIKNPPVETVQISRNPPIPGIKGRDWTTRTMTTYSLPVTQKSIPPRLSKPLPLVPLSTSANRLEAPTKEYNRSERRVNKVLGTMHINLITMTGPISPTRSLPPTALPPRRMLPIRSRPLPRKAALPAAVGPHMPKRNWPPQFCSKWTKNHQPKTWTPHPGEQLRPQEVQHQVHLCAQPRHPEQHEIQMMKTYQECQSSM